MDLKISGKESLLNPLVAITFNRRHLLLILAFIHTKWWYLDFGISVLDAVQERPEFLQTLYQGKEIYGIDAASLERDIQNKVAGSTHNNLDVYKRLLDIK